MNDRISIARVEILHPKVKDDFINFINDAEAGLHITLRVAQGVRTIDEQNALYAKGRTAPGPVVTNARGGSSYHNYGLAIDLVRMIDRAADWHFDYRKLLPYAAKYGLVWGGNFKSIKDEPHFEKTFGLNWRTMLERYNSKDFIPGTKFIRI